MANHTGRLHDAALELTHCSLSHTSNLQHSLLSSQLLWQFGWQVGGLKGFSGCGKRRTCSPRHSCSQSRNHTWWGSLQAQSAAAIQTKPSVSIKESRFKRHENIDWSIRSYLGQCLWCSCQHLGQHPDRNHQQQLQAAKARWRAAIVAWANAELNALLRLSRCSACGAADWDRSQRHLDKMVRRPFCWCSQ